MNILESRRRTLGKGVYKKTVEGNPAIAQGSLARRYPGITMQGWTEQESYEGKNLYNGIYEIDTVLDTDGTTVSYSGRSTTDFIKVSPETTYTGFTAYFRACYYDAEKVLLSYDDAETPTRQIPKGCEYTRFSFLNGSKVMFNEGSIALPYEPYTGGQPSPSPEYPQEIKNAGKYDEGTQKYSVDVRLTGKNMIPSYSELSDWKSSNYMYISVDGFIIGETYTFSQSVVPNLGEGFYVGLGSVAGNGNKGVMQWLYHNSDPGLCVESKTFVATQETYYLNVSGISNQSTLTKFLGLFPELMVELGARKTEYESYKEQTVTLTSDRPLMKWDKLEKRNGVWGWVYKSAEIVLDGSEEEAWELSQTDNYNQFYIRVDTLEHSNAEKNVYCEKFRSALIGDRETKKEIIYTVRAIIGAIAVSTELATEVDAWKTWLKSNPITVLYKSTEETFVPLSESEQEQMNELYTFRPTTVLSNDCDCNMTLTYKTKKSLQSVPGGGCIKKPSGVTSCFTFGVKWNQVNKIVFKISGVKERNNNMLLCGSSMSTPYIALSNGYLYPMLNNFSASISAEEVSDGEYHEIVFTFDTPLSNRSIVNMWDGIWSKTIIYHEIAFYNGDDLLADYVPYCKGAGYMLDKKNNVVIRATNPEDYQFA